MNISVTIPQIFYDLIARILPGALFLFILKLEVSGMNIDWSILKDGNSANLVASLFSGLGFLIICYFLGWVFRAFTVGGYSKSIKKLHVSKETPIPIIEMYHLIRLKNASEGFRIIKLRAEARMLEAARTGMIFISLIVILALVLNILSLLDLSQISVLGWMWRILLPAIFILGFYRLEKSAWDNYYGNIPVTYRLLSEIEEISKKNDQ